MQFFYHKRNTQYKEISGEKFSLSKSLSSITFKDNKTKAQLIGKKLYIEHGDLTLSIRSEKKPLIQKVANLFRGQQSSPNVETYTFGFKQSRLHIQPISSTQKSDLFEITEEYLSAPLKVDLPPKETYADRKKQEKQKEEQEVAAWEKFKGLQASQKAALEKLEALEAELTNLESQELKLTGRVTRKL